MHTAKTNKFDNPLEKSFENYRKTPNYKKELSNRLETFKGMWLNEEASKVAFEISKKIADVFNKDIFNEEVIDMVAEHAKRIEKQNSKNRKEAIKDAIEDMAA